MKLWVVAAMLVAFPAATARHTEGCVPEQADPATINHIDLTAVGGPLIYVEERDVQAPFNTQPPIPLSGFVFAGGTWTFQETNTVPGLQRGRGGLFPCLPPPPLPCLIVDEDMGGGVWDENCGHGPDYLVF